MGFHFWFSGEFFSYYNAFKYRNQSEIVQFRTFSVTRECVIVVFQKDIPILKTRSCILYDLTEKNRQDFERTTNFHMNRDLLLRMEDLLHRLNTQ